MALGDILGTAALLFRFLRALPAVRNGVTEVYTRGTFMHVLPFFLSSMKTISFTFATSWPILFLAMIIEDCLSLDAAPVPAYWMLRRRQPP
jgi:hypothetical protein